MICCSPLAVAQKIVPARTIAGGVTFILNNEQRDAYFIDLHKSLCKSSLFQLNNNISFWNLCKVTVFFPIPAIWECSNWIFTSYYLS